MEQTTLTLCKAASVSSAGLMSHNNLHLTLLYSLFMSNVVHRFLMDLAFHLSLLSVVLLI